MTGGAHRAWRRLRPDRNPLRRGSDRAETLIVSVLVMTFLAGAPLVAWASAAWAHGTGLRTEQAQRESWHRVPAVLLADAPASGSSTVMVAARWTAPAGAAHSGEIPVAPGTGARSTVRIWVDTAGRLTGPPLRPAQVTGQAVLAAVCAPAGLAVVLVWVWVLANGLLSRHRMAAWDAEWRAAGPHWSSLR